MAPKNIKCSVICFVDMHFKGANPNSKPGMELRKLFGVTLAILSGAIQVLRNAYGGGGFQIFRKKALRRCKVQCYLHYEGVGGGPISRKKRYVTLEWPLNSTGPQQS